jgi:hypothetical protein
MKKENFVIGLIGVAVVFFLLGRFSISTTEKRKKADSSDEIAKAQTDAKENAGDGAKKDEAEEATGAVAGKGAVAAGANPAANLKAAALEKRPTPTVAPSPPAAARKGAGGSLNVVVSPRKGPETAKVTIIEISDFQ